MIVKHCEMCGREYSELPNRGGRPRLYCDGACARAAYMANLVARRRAAVAREAAR